MRAKLREISLDLYLFQKSCVRAKPDKIPPISKYTFLEKNFYHSTNLQGSVNTSISFDKKISIPITAISNHELLQKAGSIIITGKVDRKCKCWESINYIS